MREGVEGRGWVWIERIKMFGRARGVAGSMVLTNAVFFRVPWVFYYRGPSGYEIVGAASKAGVVGGGFMPLRLYILKGLGSVF